MSFFRTEGGRAPARPNKRERRFRPAVDRLELRTLQTATPGIEPSNLEQYMIQLINRARANPAQEATRLASLARTDPSLRAAISDAEISAFVAEMSRHNPVAPLAFNPRLIASSRVHNQEMLRSNSQYHSDLRLLTAPTNLTQAGSDGQPYLQVDAGGAWSAAENVFAYSSNLPDSHGKSLVDYFHAAFLLDWGNPEFGHLRNLLNPGPGEVSSGAYPMSEIGIGITTDVYPGVSPGHAAITANQGLNVGPAIVTQQLAWRSGHQYLTGAVFSDQDHDGFYSLGEGLAAVTIDAVGLHGEGRFSTIAWSSGGFSLDLPAGTYIVSASGGGLVTPQSRQIVVTKANIEWNVIQTPVALPPAHISVTPVATSAPRTPETPHNVPSRSSTTAAAIAPELTARARRRRQRKLRRMLGDAVRTARANLRPLPARMNAVRQAEMKPTRFA